jgi:dienelactone hydrolase
MCTTNRALIASAVLAVSSLAQAQEAVIDLRFLGNDGEQVTIEAAITLPAKSAVQKWPAIVILHHAGGWGAGTTAQYAAFLASQGFVALEPRMFNTDGEREDTYRHMPTVFGSLAYLAGRPDVDDKKIALMGLSYGALLSLYAGTAWARAATTPTSRIRRSRRPPKPNS